MSAEKFNGKTLASMPVAGTQVDKSNRNQQGDLNTNATVDDNACVVCFKNFDLFSLGECDHPVCYECSTRMRVLCQQNECPICRQVLSKVIYVYYNSYN